MIVITSNNIDYEQLITCLRQGGVIVYSTDTAYALGADATNKEGIEKIFKIKSRDTGKTLPLIVADMQMAESWATFSPRARELANKYWPGPLTLVLPVTSHDLPASLVQDNFVALRVPQNKIACQISANLGGPIIATSANASGQGSFYSTEDVRVSLGESINLVDYIIDAGLLSTQGVSTLVKVCGDKIEVLRQGIIKISSSCWIPK